MPDLADGQAVEMAGSGSRPYLLKNVGGVYSCSCPAWRNQSIGIERRTCKHLRKLRGDAAEEARVGSALTLPPTAKEKPTAPALLLADSWDGVADPTGWWLSEKLDGVRAYWDGRQFLSRQGNRFHAPDWFTAGLPACPLDGELWIGRKQFQRAVSIVRRQDQSDHWKEVRYLIFDAPGEAGGFEKRQAFLKGQFAAVPAAQIQLLAQEPCRGLEHLREELARIEGVGGEGLMLRQPGSRYEAGRSPTLLKVKSFLDAEAVVVGHEPGAGKHKGRLGALAAMLPSGVRFAVGTGLSDAERVSPPPIGATITFRYQELTEAGVPRFPSYVGVRLETPAPLPAQPTEESAMTKTTPVPLAASAAGVHRFEFVEGTSSKFWEGEVVGSDLLVRYGRIGTEGQRQTKTFADHAKAQQQLDKLIREKTAKGYRAVG